MAGLNIPELDIDGDFDQEKRRYMRPDDPRYDLLEILARNERSRWMDADEEEAGVLVQPWVLGLLARRMKEISDHLGLGPLQP